VRIVGDVHGRIGAYSVQLGDMGFKKHYLRYWTLPELTHRAISSSPGTTMTTFNCQRMHYISSARANSAPPPSSGCVARPPPTSMRVSLAKAGGLRRNGPIAKGCVR